MSPYYELHITYLGEPAPEIPRWSQSTIDGDIILGEGPKRYLTHHARGDADERELIADTEHTAQRLRLLGRTVLRTKVERVLYDRRTKS